MTVETIIPCICAGDKEWDPAESVYKGMPQLKVSCGLVPHKQFWTAFCPNCGRGGVIEHTSPYLALKKWNEMQTQLRHNQMPWAEETKKEDHHGKENQCGSFCSRSAKLR